MVFVAPRFGEMFESRGMELPLPTQLIIGTSQVLRGYWYLFVGAGLGADWGIRRAWRTPSSRRNIDTWLHYISFMRDVLKGLAIGRSCRQKPNN